MDLPRFLKQSQDETLNKCLINKCQVTKSKKNGKCNTQKELLFQIFECLKEQVGNESISKSICQTNCEIENFVKPSWQRYFLEKDDKYLASIEKFFKNKGGYISAVNQCIFSNKEIWSHFSQLEQNQQQIDGEKEEKIFNQAMKDCFRGVFYDEYKGIPFNVYQCAYKCQVFQPYLLPKIKSVGQSFKDIELEDDKKASPPQNIPQNNIIEQTEKTE